MSRILEALRKVDAEREPLAVPRTRGAEAHAHVEPEPSRPAAPRVESPAAAVPAAVEPAPQPAWGADAAPDLPEDFRRELEGLRLQVDAALANRRPRVLMLTSSTGEEGTTTVAASLARVLARDPALRVLLVDAHARRPGVDLFFGLAPGPGLFQALAAGLPVADLVRPVDRHNLHVLTTLPGDAGLALVSAAQLRAFLSEIGVQYDYVLFDAPPVLEAPETLVLGGVVDTSILVVRAASTKGGVVDRAVDTLANAGVPVLGLVLNRRRLEIPEFLYKRI
jgi:tyrosine-protein kinase Etk/Wzc